MQGDVQHLFRGAVPACGHFQVLIWKSEVPVSLQSQGARASRAVVKQRWLILPLNAFVIVYIKGTYPQDLPPTRDN